MPIAIIVVVALICLPVLYLGGRATRTWAEYRDALLVGAGMLWRFGPQTRSRKAAA